MVDNMLFFLEEAEESLFTELWNYFIENYFTADFSNLKNFSVPSSYFISLPTMLLGIFVGVIIASVAAIIQKRVIGDFVRALSSGGITTPQSAKTIAEMGFMKNTFVRSALRRGASLRKLVRCVGDDEADGAVVAPDGSVTYPGGYPEKKQRTDLGAARFYLPEGLRIRAEIRYEKKGTDWLTFALVVVASVLLMVGLVWVIPDLLTMFDNFITLLGETF